ncbi:MAG: hypothetical protein LBM07_01995 [Culturomica sp.]|jgi:hypothetical protein|nr:hypothetical protein [Culturomica sp.]
MENPFATQEFENDMEVKPKRPTLLTVLCILTFIGSGFSLIGQAITAFVGESFMSQITEIYAEQGVVDAETMTVAIDLAKVQAPYMIVLFIASLVGAIMMFMMKRLGFYIYSVAQVIILGLPMCFGSKFDIFGLIITVIFIILYAKNLKLMK